LRRRRYHAIGSIIGSRLNLSGINPKRFPGLTPLFFRAALLRRLSPHRSDRAFFSVMKAVDRFARSGGLFLHLQRFSDSLEAGLLPGAMMRNKGLRYLCRQVHIRVESTDTPLPGGARGQVLMAPIAHNDGNYFCELPHSPNSNATTRLFFRYVTPDEHDAAENDRDANPNARWPPSPESAIASGTWSA